MFCHHVHSKITLRSTLIAVCCLLALLTTHPATAQQPSVTVNSFNGRILVAASSQPLSPQAQFGAMGPAGAPAILTYRGDVRVVSAPDGGYRVVTQPGTDATLTLPDESQILIREMSILELNGFARDNQTKAQGMLMSLYAGSVRIMLSQVYQRQETFFEVRTPNALVSLHFSQPDVEVIYAPSPLEDMALLLEEGSTLEAEEEQLWQDVLTDREEDVLRRQNAPVQLAALQSEGAAMLPPGSARLALQEAFARIGLIQSEEDALLQARLLQRDEALTERLPGAAAQAQVASTSSSGLGLPSNIDLEQWQVDGLITGEDDAGKGATFVFAYTVSVSFMNRITREIRTIQHGQRAVVRGKGITMTVMDGNPMQSEPPRDVGTTFAFESQTQTPELNEPDDSNILSQEDASSSSPPSLFPGPSGRPDEASSNRPQPHKVEIVIEE